MLKTTINFNSFCKKKCVYCCVNLSRVFFCLFGLLRCIFGALHVCFCTYVARVVKLLLWCVKTPTHALLCRTLTEIHYHQFCLCWVLCLCLFVCFFTYTLLSKICSISAVFVRCCTWPRDSFWLFLLHLLCFLGLEAICKLGCLFVVLCVRFFVTFLLVLVVDFVCWFCLFCCAVAYAPRVNAFLTVLLLLFVFQFGFGALVVLWRILCARVHVLCHYVYASCM